MSRSALDLLLDLAVRGSLLFVAAAGLALLLRRRSAALRHLVWSITMTGVVALPVLALVLPSWPMPLLPAWTSGAGVGRPVKGVERVLVAIWLIGVLGALVRLAAGRLGVRALMRRARPVRDPAWCTLAGTVARRLGIRRPIALYESDGIGVPVTWGIRRPVVLLPATAREWPRERLRVALLHELSHVRRLDALTHAIARVCHAVCWFNPLAWLAMRQMRLERERACDDSVLLHGVRASGYARDLLELARSTAAASRPAAPALAMAWRTELEGRLVAILDARRHRARVRPRTGAAMVTTAAALIVPLATVRLVPKRVEPPRHAPGQVARAPASDAEHHAPTAVVRYRDFARTSRSTR